MHRRDGDRYDITSEGNLAEPRAPLRDLAMRSIAGTNAFASDRGASRPDRELGDG
jgi:hypothetical protein